MTSCRSALLLAALLGLAAAACGRPRYAHYAVDRTAFSRHTAHATGWMEPPADPPVASLAELEPGRTLVLTCGDFDKGISFEAMVARTDDPGRVYSVLTLTDGRAGPPTIAQRNALSMLLDVDTPALRDAPAPEAEAYDKSRDELERAVTADPAAGLETIALHASPLFPRDAAGLAGRVVRHAAMTDATLSAVAEYASGRRAAGPALRGWFRAGGAARLLRDVLQQQACTPTLALSIATDALAGSVRGDREVLILDVLERSDLDAPDLRSLLSGILGADAPSTERRRLVLATLGHASAEDVLIEDALRGLEAIEFSADRRLVLSAMLDVPGPRSEGVMLAIVRAAASQLDYDEDREVVLVAAIKHASATPALLAAVREALSSFRYDEPRKRVEDALDAPK